MKRTHDKHGLHRLWRNGRLALLAGCLACTAAGCELLPKRGSDAAAPPTTGATAPVQAVSGKQEPPPAAPAVYRAPLTGLELKQKAVGRPVMVMVNNHPSARPQSGLTQADVLYECLAEGEITRIVAVFQSRSFADPIGPVRSIRPYFIEMGKGLDAVQVHAGGSPDAYAQLEREKIDELDEITNAGPYFWRETFRKAPHNLYTNLEKIHAGMAKRGLNGSGSDAPVFRFAPTDAEAVETMGAQAQGAKKVDVTFLLSSYVVSYAYDEASHLYKRSINGVKHIDLNNNEQLTAANVIVMGTDHKVLDNEGRLDVRLTGTGQAKLFQQGKVKDVQWKREKESDPVRYYDQGREISLVPGQTHVLIVPMKPSFEGHLKVE
ncbi:DUF3048 domain-containing protein [Paenibacillus cremeus]|uniref:DUF3048 domain-containing protein n=2 Tax=Paenibacillus cremeus TaxID=2163881 RepID=A0A559K4D7_9BACL|nr:DUF3048 domain-containing protein [Paenibacillus cremeus]